MKINNIKKKLLLVLVLFLSTTTFIYRTEIFIFINNIENISLGNPFITALVLIALKGLSAVVGFPGTPLTLVTGSLLGYFFGTIVALIGNTLGAMLAFLLARYVLKDYVQNKFFPKYPGIKIYQQKLENNAWATVVALRLIPLFPFNALNFLLGVTNVPLRTYVTGSFVGMIPGTFLFVYFGESLRMLNPLNIGLAIVGIIVLTYAGKFYGKNI